MSKGGQEEPAATEPPCVQVEGVAPEAMETPGKAMMCSTRNIERRTIATSGKIPF